MTLMGRDITTQNEFGGKLLFLTRVGLSKIDVFYDVWAACFCTLEKLVLIVGYCVQHLDLIYYLSR